MQRVAPGIGDAFGPVEKALRENFFPALFEGLGDGSTGARDHPPASETGRTGPSITNTGGP